MDPNIMGELCYDENDAAEGFIFKTSNDVTVQVLPAAAVYSAEAGSFDIYINCSPKLPLIGTNTLQYRAALNPRASSLFAIHQIQQMVMWLIRRAKPGTRVVFFCETGTMASAQCAKIFGWFLSPQQEYTEIWMKMYQAHGGRLQSVYPEVDIFFSNLFTVSVQQRFRMMKDESKFDEIYHSLFQTRNTPKDCIGRG